MIRKSAVMERLNLVRMKAEMDRKMPATKRRVINSTIDEITQLVDEIVPEAEAPKEEPKPKTAKMDCNLEPIMVGSQIGIDRYRCHRCNTVVDKHDQFCRKCGSMFEKEAG